ncbi:MAG: nucleotidyltransferase [Candidatus Peregrinibacteria bacterium]
MTTTLTPALNLDLLAAAPSIGEQNAAATTHTMIRTFIENESTLSKYSIETQLHGSYKNSTNVRRESDVDIGAMSEQIFLYDISGLPADQVARFHETTSAGSFTFQEYRNDVLASLRRKYGSEVIDGNKAITISGNTYRLSADILPCVEFHHYWDYMRSSGNYAKGIAFLTKDGKRVVNFPQQHFENMTTKNTATNEYFKGCVRIMKRIRNDLICDRVISEKHSPSCYIESLLWNAPNVLFSGGYSAAMRGVLAHLYKTLDDGSATSYVQANRVYVLFHSEFWSMGQAKELILYVWSRIFP